MEQEEFSKTHAIFRNSNQSCPFFHRNMIMLDLISAFPFPYTSGNAMGPSPRDLRTNCEGFHQKKRVHLFSSLKSPRHFDKKSPGLVGFLLGVGRCEVACRYTNTLRRFPGSQPISPWPEGCFLDGDGIGVSDSTEKPIFWMISTCGRYGYCFPKVGTWDSYFIIT